MQKFDGFTDTVERNGTLLYDIKITIAIRNQKAREYHFLSLCFSLTTTYDHKITMTIREKDKR